MFFSNIFQSSKNSETNDKMSSGLSSESWLVRNEERSFKESFSYCGVVECIQSKLAATVVIAQKRNGKPLMWHEVWDPRKDQFGRVLLLVGRLRSSVNGETYKKDTPIDTVLQDGDCVMVEVKYSSQSPDNIFNYFANSAYKSTTMFTDLPKIRDPLRGVVDSMMMEAAVVRFGPFVGGVAKCILTIHNMYYKGEKVKLNLPLGAVVSVGTQIYLEVTRWNASEVNQEWEKLMYKEGVIFRATKAWLKDDPRPSKVIASKQEKINTVPTKDFSASMTQERADRTKRSGMENPGRSLTNHEVYYGVVEAITSSITAVVCTAHRNGEPLSWKENWLARGVMLERALLLVDHIRPSKTQPEYMKGTDIRKILEVGDPLMIVVEMSEKKPDRCYKWFVRTSWKVEGEESCTIVESNLPGHMRGVVDCLLTHSIGIIVFITQHGMPAKAFFTHSNFYQNGEKIMDHLPLGSEVKKGTEVFLIAERWNPGKHPNSTDQEMIRQKVCFRATLVWNKGSPKPKEGESFSAKKNKIHNSEEHRKQGLPKNSHSERFKKYEESRGSRGKRGGNPRFRGRGRNRGTGNRSGSGRDTGDCASNCSDDSDISDISSMSDYFGAMKVEEGNFSDSSHSSRGLKGRDPFCDIEQEYTNPSDNGQNGTIVSIDEDWGMVQLDDDVYDFKPSHVSLYGLKLDDVKLSRLLRQGQNLKVYLKGNKVSLVEYGTSQLPNQMRKAVVTYCENNQVSKDVRENLERTMQKYGV